MRMRPLSIFGGTAAGVLICLGAVGTAPAQDSGPPGRAAQLSYAEGSVAVEPAGTGSWTSAVQNRPLTLGDKIWSDQDSRAELDIGDAVIRLGSSTGFSFLNLDEQTAQMQVTAGTVIVHVRSLASGEQDEIDTPNVALSLQQPGTYRVEVSDTGDTTIVKVDDGEALATGGGQSFPVTAQQSVTFTGTSVLTADYATLGSPDALDDWSMQRDREEQQQAAVAQQYVSPDVVGATDLGSYGAWQSTPDWGYAWFPSVPVGWAPYSVGYWVWISPWGWSWVDEEPWGFAPFHYGRWDYWHHRWCWVPGPRRKRPIYAPALVGWVGGRPVRGSEWSGSHVGWFPLGPRDVYVPGYHASAEYVRNINFANSRITDTAYINDAYRGRVRNARYTNSDVPGAIIAVPRRVFTSAQPVGPHRVVVPRRGGIDLRASTAAPAIVPVRQSVLGADRGRIVRPPPRAIVDRPVVARLAPPRAPVSFAREQAAIRAKGGRPLTAAELSRLRPYTPAAPVRLAHPSVRARPGMELHTAPANRGAPAADMSAREHTLQYSTLPPARAPRSDRPAWAQQPPMRSGAATDRAAPQTAAPRQQQGSLEWQVPPRRDTAPERQAPAQRVAPPDRQAPEQRFSPPERQVPPERIAPPVRQAPPQRFAPPERQVGEPRFTPPERQIPPQRFTPPPSYHPSRESAPPPAPRAAPAPPPEGRPAERPSSGSHPPVMDRRAAAPRLGTAPVGSRRAAGVGVRRIS